MGMEISLKVEVMPFSVPTRVYEVINKDLYRETGEIPDITYPLSALDTFTLNKLCEQFRQSVFAVAGKECPNIYY